MTKCEQIERTGQIVLDYDQVLNRNEIKKYFSIYLIQLLGKIENNVFYMKKLHY